MFLKEKIMLTFSDFDRVDTTQFNILEKSSYSLAIQSKQTGNCWYIFDHHYKNVKSLSVFKAIVYGSEYHHHCNSTTIPQALEMIKRAERSELLDREQKYRMRESAV